MESLAESLLYVDLALFPKYNRSPWPTMENW